MAETIEFIDAVARRLGRDVLYLRLVDEAGEPRDVCTDISDVTSWLDENGIGWQLCCAFNTDGVWMEGGPGAIYLDVVHEANDAKVALLEAYFMKEDGSPAISGYAPSMLKLEDAMINAHQDEEGYWDDF